VGRLRGKPWSVEEEKQLSELVKAGKRINEIAAVFGKSRKHKEKDGTFSVRSSCPPNSADDYF